MKLTPKQRAKIYREAAEYFTNDIDRFGCGRGFCWWLREVRRINYFLLDEFVEIELFDFKSDYNTWFLNENDDDGNFIHSHNLRVTALLLAEQIALNPLDK